jgi:hypothetical protein
MTATSFRDVEQLSAYLDGELSQAERARLKSRLARDPGLSAALEELRQARTLLRRTPQRGAPRNFTLTPKMAGLRPPLPRAFPVLRLSSAVATLLLFITFAGELLGPIALGAQAPAPQVMAPAYGGGVGGGPAENAPAATDKGGVVEAIPTPQVMAPAYGGGPAENTPAATDKGGAVEATSTPEVMAPAYGGGGPAENTPVATDKGGAVEATPTPEVNALLAPEAMPEATPALEARTLEQPVPPPAPLTPEENAAKPPFTLSPLQIALLALAVILGGSAFLLRWQTSRAFAKNVKRKT